MMFRDDPDLLPTLVTLAAIAALVLIGTSGCTPVQLQNIEQIFRSKAEYCQSVSDRIEAYRKCME